MDRKTDYQALTLTLDENEEGGRMFRGEFAFSGKDAVGENGLYLPASKYRPFDGQTLRLRVSHRGDPQAIGVGVIRVNQNVAYVEGKMMSSPLAQSFMEEADLTSEMGGKLSASISNLYDWSTLREGSKMSAAARRAGASYEYDIHAVSHLAFVEAGNIERASLSVNDDQPELYPVPFALAAAIEMNSMSNRALIGDLS